ncbi:hypothetical protein G8A07_21340 [Roseateles sp. DAIF2]|uniref:hypothetical protein n=1 Tax=Roseateles sp. DAIF2 TaxID=2714952 RepID=UPI0018A2E23F|nr:hypothetical protein [Roseateles sp. DAIF2]QPF75207.1 hypothetical protein G8A07_21340 [Roseateles sp. DAIF2]
MDLSLPLLLSLPDSELAALEWPGPEGILLLRLAVAQVEQRPAGEPRGIQGYSRGVVLRLHQARIERLDDADGPLLGRIGAESALRVGPQRRAGLLPLPGTIAGPLHLELVMAQGGWLLAAGGGLELAFEAGVAPNFRELLAC